MVSADPVNHVVSGGDYGWRQGTDKWPGYFPDSLPSNLDIGLGSPTAIAFGANSHFPEPYRNALFILDWAYWKIFAVHLTPDGASYRGRFEEFRNRPATQCNRRGFGQRALYFTTGGGAQSGLSNSLTGKPRRRRASALEHLEAAKQSKLRRRLEVFIANSPSRTWLGLG